MFSIIMKLICKTKISSKGNIELPQEFVKNLSDVSMYYNENGDIIISQDDSLEEFYSNTSRAIKEYESNPESFKAYAKEDFLDELKSKIK